MNLIVFSDFKSTAHIAEEHADYSPCGAYSREYDTQRFIDAQDLHATLDKFSEQGLRLCQSCLRKYE